MNIAIQARTPNVLYTYSSKELSSILSIGKFATSFPFHERNGFLLIEIPQLLVPLLIEYLQAGGCYWTSSNLGKKSPSFVNLCKP